MLLYAASIPVAAWTLSGDALAVLNRASAAPGAKGVVSRLWAFLIAACLYGLPLWGQVTGLVDKYGGPAVPDTLRWTAFFAVLAALALGVYFGYVKADSWKATRSTRASETTATKDLGLQTPGAKETSAALLVLESNLMAQQSNLAAQQAPKQEPGQLLALQGNLTAQQANLVALQLAATLSSSKSDKDSDPSP